MASHSASSLFNKNIKSAEDCLELFDAVSKLNPQGVNTKWILRAAIVFTVSAIDAYFHDKVKYSVGKIKLSNAPSALMRFEITVSKLTTWAQATRKGNVLRNWVVEYLSTKPLQSPDAVANALKLVGIEKFWDTVEPDKTKKDRLLTKFKTLVSRRNKIAHEGDRQSSRRSGKKLRAIGRVTVANGIKYAKNLIAKVERRFPG